MGVVLPETKEVKKVEAVLRPDNERHQSIVKDELFKIAVRTAAAKLLF